MNDKHQTGDKADSERNLCSCSTTQEFLANENIFLAWVRTGLTLMSLGFVVNQFGFWLEEFAFTMASHTPAPHISATVYMGVGMVVFGGILCSLAAFRYYKVYVQILRGNVQGDRWLIGLVTALTAILTLVMVAFMLSSSRQF